MSDVECSSIRLEDGEIDEGNEPCVSSSSMTTGDPKESTSLSPRFIEEVMNSSEECDEKASEKRPNLEESPKEKNQPEVTSSSSRSAFEMKEAFDRFEEDEMLCVRGASPVPFVCTFVDQSLEASRSCFSRNTPPYDSDSINVDLSPPKRSSKSSHRRQRRKRSLPKKVVREKYVSSDDGHSDEPKSKKSQPGRGGATAQETSQQICKFYYLDFCAKGPNCMYMHSQFPCKYFYLGLKCPDEEATGKCKLAHGKELSAEMKNALYRHIHTAPTSILGEEFVALRRSFVNVEKMIEHHEQKLQAAAHPEGYANSDKVHSPAKTLRIVQKLNRLKAATTNSQATTACEASIPAVSTFSQAELDFFEQLKQKLFFLDQSQLDMLKEFRMTKVEDLSNLTLAQLNAVGILAVQIDAIQRGFETTKGQDTDMRNLYQCAPLNVPFENFANNVDVTVEVVEDEPSITNWEEEEETSLVIDESAQEDEVEVEDKLEDNIEIDVVGDESPIYVEPVKEGEMDPLLDNQDDTECLIDSPIDVTTEVFQEELQYKTLSPIKTEQTTPNLDGGELWDEVSQEGSDISNKLNDETTPTTESSLKNSQDETPPPLDEQRKSEEGPKLRRRTRFRSISPPNTKQNSEQVMDSKQVILSPIKSATRKERTSESEEMWDEESSDQPLKANDEATPKTAVSWEQSLDATPPPLEEQTKTEKSFIKDASDKELRLLKRTNEKNPFRTEKVPLETNDFWEKDSRHVTPPNVVGQSKGFPITPRKSDCSEAYFIDTTPTKYTGGEYTRRNIDPQSNDLRHLLTQRTLQKEMSNEMQGDNSSEDWDADEPKSLKTPLHPNDSLCFPDNSDMDSAVFVPDGTCPDLPLRTPNLDNYKPAIEIDAHLTYPAMDYKLYEIYLPPYDVNKPRLMEKLLKSNSSDPRLKKLLEREKNGGIFPQSDYSFFPPGMPQVDPRLRLGNSTASDPNYNASPILYGYLQRSLWYQELKSNLKIQINHSVSDLVRALNAFHKDPSPKKIFDLFQIECAGVLLEVMRNVGIFIDANGNIIEEPNYKQLCAPQFLAQPVKPGLLGYAPPGVTYSRPQMPLASPPNENSFARQAFGNDFGYSNNEFQPPPTGFYVGERNFQNNRGGGPPMNFEPAFQRPGGNRNPQRRL